MAKPTIWWPLDRVVITGPWGVARAGLAGHNGIDLGGNIGTPVYAGDDGVVEFEGWGQNHSWMGAVAGVCVLVKHWWGYTGYAHMNSTIVDRGQRVSRGQQLGTLGSTGWSTGPHVHFETLPLSPNFGNGYAGRVNPTSIANIVPRGASPAPTPTPSPGQEEDEEMNVRQMHWQEDGKLMRAMHVPGTAYFITWTEGSGAKFANGFARNWDTGSSVEVTASLARAIRNAAAAMLPAGRVQVEMVDAGE